LWSKDSGWEPGSLGGLNALTYSVKSEQFRYPQLRYCLLEVFVMPPQEPKRRRASAERHEISRREVTDAESSSDRVRFLKLAAIALDGPDGTPYAEHGAAHDGLIWNDGQWNNCTENRRQARELLHYAQN
jgi:hypothetical protein